MRILFLSQIVPYPPHGGVLQRGYYLLRELSEANEVHLLAFSHPDILDSNEKIQTAKRHLLAFCQSVDFITLQPKRKKRYFLTTLVRSFFSLKPFSALAHASTQFQRRLECLLVQTKFDIIHYDTIALAQYLLSNQEIPKTLTHHNVESDLMFRRAKMSKNLLAKSYLYLNAMKLARYERKFLPKFDHNIACSQLDKEKLLRMIPSLKVSVVPNGVDTSFFMPSPEKEKNNMVIHVGALQSANLDGILFFLKRIWPLIKKQRENTKLVLVGGSIPEYIENLGRTSKDIVITGYIEDFRPLVWEAAVFVVPLRMGGGTKLKVLDALANGKAVVSTSIGIEGIEVTPGRNIIVADRPEDFAGEVVRLLDSPMTRSQLGKEGRRLVEEKYDWRIIGKLQEQIFEQKVEQLR